MNEYGLSYGTKEEFKFRFGIFQQIDKELEEINGEQDDYVVAHNQFSTMTPDEKKKYFGRKPTEVNDNDENVEFLPEDNLAAGIDWRSKGAVNPVQDQKSCGSCWAFSSTAAMEGAHFIKTGKLLKLSESQFVDCDPKSEGCNGGLETNAFTYAKKHAQELEKDYPYSPRTNRCKANAKLGKV
jgi:C1A family cysteine protease